MMSELHFVVYLDANANDDNDDDAYNAQAHHQWHLGDPAYRPYALSPVGVAAPPLRQARLHRHSLIPLMSPP